MDANPDLKLRGYNIDEGGVKARNAIRRMIKANAEADRPAIAAE